MAEKINGNGGTYQVVFSISKPEAPVNEGLVTSDVKLDATDHESARKQAALVMEEVYRNVLPTHIVTSRVYCGYESIQYCIWTNGRVEERPFKQISPRLAN